MPLALGLAKKIGYLATDTSKACTNKGNWKNKCSCSKPEPIDSVCSMARLICHGYILREEFL